MNYLLLLVAAFFAGAINSVAGGGTLLTFPSLLSVGVLPVSANATSTVALVPGSFGAFWGFRSEMGHMNRYLALFGIPSALGGLVGAMALLQAGDRLFSRLVPWLILAATGLLLMQEPMRRWTAKRVGRDPQQRSVSRWTVAGVVVLQLFIAMYGGFFGAGAGILMLGAFGFLDLRSIHRMNGLKNFCAVCINTVASTTLIAHHKVLLPIAVLMACGAIAGGYTGAGIAKRIGQHNVRRIVVATGLCIGVGMLVKRYL